MKRNLGDTSVPQLKRYIKDCRKEERFRDREIQGWIICGRRAKELEENAGEYRIIEYHISMDFQPP